MPNPVFELHHRDCLEGMRDLPAESVDAVVTSPPYNLGIQYSKFRDDANRPQFLEWCERWAAQVLRVLKPNGSFFLNVGAAPADPLLPHQLALRFSNLFTLQNTLHWIKSISVETRAGEAFSVGHFKPIKSPRFITDCHEYVFHFTKEGTVPVDRLAVGVPYSDKSNIARWGHTGGRDLRCRGNNWFVPYETIMSRDSERPHPATFPIQLATLCIKLHGTANCEGGGVVLDPFVGIGHAALAAIECGVGKFIGFDIDEGYLAEAWKRVSERGCTIVTPEPVAPAFPPPQTEPKKRGRPQKEVAVDGSVSPDTESCTNTISAATSPAPPANPPKKRGRPRKTPAPAVNEGNLMLF